MGDGTGRDPSSRAVRVVPGRRRDPGRRARGHRRRQGHRGPRSPIGMSWGRPHLDELRRALPDDAALARVRSWGERLAALLRAGGRLLAVGNGGSAAHAQHLTAELVGRYVVDRPPFSAIALHADTSALTALVNDYP